MIYRDITAKGSDMASPSLNRYFFVIVLKYWI